MTFSKYNLTCHHHQYYTLQWLHIALRMKIWLLQKAQVSTECSLYFSLQLPLILFSLLLSPIPVPPTHITPHTSFCQKSYPLHPLKTYTNSSISNLKLHFFPDFPNQVKYSYCINSEHYESFFHATAILILYLFVWLFVLSICKLWDLSTRYILWLNVSLTLHPKFVKQMYEVYFKKCMMQYIKTK